MMVPPESYETEGKDKIDICLNCPLPQSVCFGSGMCYLRKRKRRGELENLVYVMIKEGKNRSLIMRRTGISYSMVCRVLTRLVEKGIITQEEADNSRVNRRLKDERD